MTVLQAKRYQGKTRSPREVSNGVVSCSNQARNPTPLLCLQQEGYIVPIKSPIMSVKNQKDICSAVGKSATTETLYVRGEVENAAMRKAHESATSLHGNKPTLIKLMQFFLPRKLDACSLSGLLLAWQHLLVEFCHKHLPDRDMVIDQEDDNGKVYPTQYLARKHCLSGGWRAFSIYHKLVEGDAVVFQLLEPTKFKVYVVRASGSEEVELLWTLRN